MTTITSTQIQIFYNYTYAKICLQKNVYIDHDFVLLQRQCWRASLRPRVQKQETVTRQEAFAPASPGATNTQIQLKYITNTIRE